MFTMYLIIFLLLIITAVVQNAPLIEITNGWLQGTVEKSYRGRSFSSFEGIPFAKPPVGKLRFELAATAYNWTGIWFANTKHTCIQSHTDLLIGVVAGNEDCLYVNVYVPRKNPNLSDSLDVIVHFHGGAFMVESSHSYAGPKYLMDEEVILVTVNYRLGPFGFLYTEDDIIPGNNGMKDQILSLQWIQKNIKYFGGNPNSVTITGMSAGGASVHLHYFSPLSEGLFHRGFSESGTALDSWVIHDGSLQKAKHLANILGCPTGTSEKIVDCLKSRPAAAIANAGREFSPVYGFPIAPFGPVIENAITGAFLTDHPYRMLKQNNVKDIPWVLSIAEKEMSSTALHFNDKLETLYKEFDKYAPHIFDYYTFEEVQKNTISKEIKHHYFNDSVNVEKLGELLGDRLFIAGAAISAKLQAKANKAPVYFYILGYKGQHGVAEYFVGIDLQNDDACHGDGILYYFNTPISEGTLSESDEKMKTVYLQWLTKYANNRVPEIDNVKWKPVDGDGQLCYLYIQNPNNMYMKSQENLGSNNFWKKMIYQQNVFLRDEL